VGATDVGGTKESLDPGVTGWAMDTAAPQHLAARIKWLHDNQAVLQAARIKGPQWVRRQFGIARMIEDTIRVYNIAPWPWPAASRVPFGTEMRAAAI
jgi:glycosyltransferase involved in cell wall biosynthesis